MESVLGRYRNLIVLVGVLFVQVLGLAVQVKRTTDTDSSRLIRVWAVGSVSPLEKALVWVQTSTGNLWHNYFYLRGVRAENRELKQQIEQMRIEQVRMSQDADQARRLQALLAFKEQFISQTKAAQVIGSSGSEQSRAIYIDKGEKDGIRPDMAVINANGVVGKVLHVYRSTALVLLISDQTSGVGAILEKSRLQGILRGLPSGEVALEKVMSDEQVPPGELVLTSGGDRVFPKGLTIGTVTKVYPGSDFFLNIHVRPSADLSKLEEVLVVTKIDERQATPEQTGPVRAADILAERLPSVPPKPPDVAPKAEGTAAQAAAAPGQKAPAAATALPAGPKAGPASGPTNKPKAATPTADASGAVPASPKPVTKAPSSPANGANTVKVSQESAKPAVQPKPQPPAQDNPQ
jgi:rod shape-determining protein MreC